MRINPLMDGGVISLLFLNDFILFGCWNVFVSTQSRNHGLLNGISFGLNLCSFMLCEVSLLLELVKEWWVVMCWHNKKIRWVMSEKWKLLKCLAWLSKALISLVDRVGYSVYISLNIVMEESVSGGVTDVVNLVLDVSICSGGINVLSLVVHDVYICCGAWACHI